MRLPVLFTLVALTTAQVSVLGVVSPSYAADTVRDFVRNPIVKQAAIGAGVGALGGAASDRRSVGKSAVVGGLIGAGTGTIDKTGVMDNHPLARRSVKGAAIGAGTGYILGKNPLTSGAVGAGGGAVYHYGSQWVNRR